MNEKQIYESQENDIALLKKKVSAYEKKNDSLVQRLQQVNYFSLLGNDNAMTYYENMGFEAAEVENRVREHIYDLNGEKGNNPIVPYDGIEGRMKINKVKFLNHRWVVADFTDGTYWGEMVLEYYINEDKSIDLNVIGSLLYGG
ncbi:hypothetical protein DDV96_11905 [Marixanthomonas spongiae]|uniref:Hydrolase n=2 Tax=Marixanthomonas spongiae TaxID=2174845 RepID=A0A2U0HYA3_9FLAO|nr:hypothetical protein DDV96_11905 [Marixanthomonas spongiae]